MPLINLNDPKVKTKGTLTETENQVNPSTVLTEIENNQVKEVTHIGEGLKVETPLKMSESNTGVKEFVVGIENKLIPKKIQQDISQGLPAKLTTHTQLNPVNPSNNTVNNQLPVQDLQVLAPIQSVQGVLNNQNLIQPSTTPLQQEVVITPTIEKNLDTLNLKKYDLVEILKEGISLNSSDVHLSVGYRAMVRVDGVLQSLNTNILTPQDLIEFSREFLKIRSDVRLETIKEFDMSYPFMGRRFRVNIFKQMGHFAIVARIIPEQIKSVEELDLPVIIKEFANINSGLVLVTGPTGSGKSTTLASILNYINLTKKEHIITLEDPVEFVFPKGTSLIDQREFGIDFDTWETALRAILRQDPDIVLVGEMRDYETIASAITVSETGHLVFATLHTNSAAQTIDRIIDVFPETQQLQIRAQLASVITAVVSQRLVPLSNGGRKAVMEIMIATPAIKNAIREGKTHQIDNMIQTGQDFGMISMEKSLITMVRKGLISADTAKAFSTKPDEIEMLLSQS
jgi:twitching motility protein PilT